MFKTIPEAVTDVGLRFLHFLTYKTILATVKTRTQESAIFQVSVKRLL